MSSRTAGLAQKRIVFVDKCCWVQFIVAVFANETIFLMDSFFVEIHKMFSDAYRLFASEGAFLSQVGYRTNYVPTST